LFTSWSPGVERGYSRENHIYICLYGKKIFFSRTSGPISIKLGTNHRWVKGILNCSNKGSGSLQRGDNHKNAKMGWGHLKIFFSRTTEPILTRLGTNLSWGEEIQGCSNKGDCLSPWGDNSETKNTLKSLKKIFFSRTCRPNSIKLSTNYSWVKGIQVCSNKGPGLL
jgi:hypothetical protein